MPASVSAVVVVVGKEIEVDRYAVADLKCKHGTREIKAGKLAKCAEVHKYLHALHPPMHYRQVYQHKTPHLL